MLNIFTKFEFLLLAQVLIKLVCSQEDCNPYTNCASYSPGHKVPDPKNCHNYYLCIEDANGNVVPSDNVYECNPGYYFYYYYADCEYGSCTNDCLNICALECTTYEYERVADPNDCSYFYTCRPGGLKVRSQCPGEAHYFDGSECMTDSFSCCDTCVPYCPQEYEEVVDPLDCRNYYLCTETGQPSESDKFSCPEYEYFDSSVGKCAYEDPSNPCSALCSSSGNSTESSIR